MGKIIIPRPVKLFFGLISNDEALFLTAKKMLENKLGPVDFTSEKIRFDYTDYYRNELGVDLKRIFFSFKRLVDPVKISDIKIYSNRLEESLAKSGKRRINIDPGYLDLAKLVLASTKDFSHRIYTGKGIYAEITLVYKNASYRPLEWTYPDYRTADYQNIFQRIREIYHQQIRCEL